MFMQLLNFNPVEARIAVLVRAIFFRPSNHLVLRTDELSNKEGEALRAPGETKPRFDGRHLIAGGGA